MRLALPEHRRGGGLGLVVRIAPGLQPHPSARARVGEGRAVPCGEDPRVRGAQRGVDDDPVVDDQARGLGERGRGCGTDAGDDRVDDQLVAVGEHRPHLIALTAQPGDRRRDPKGDPVRRVQGDDLCRDLLGHDPSERPRPGLDDRDVHAAFTRSGGDLETDEPGPDDEQMPLRAQQRAQRLRVLVGAQVGHLVELEMPRVRAQGEQQTVPGHLGRLAATRGPTRGRAHGAGLEVDARHLDTQPQVDPGLLELLRRPRVDEGHLVDGQRSLRQRRSLVGVHRLPADEGDLAVKSLVPQRHRRVRAALAGSDDDDPPHVRGQVSRGRHGPRRPRP